MRPGHIKVFDGLRITTEHMNHLQGSFHSAIEDIRKILGLGQVYQGFEVVAEGEKAITVEPGLAFDFQKNRIACEEPKTFEVIFDQEEGEKFVCIKYDQIEKDPVHGQFTRIWDGCSVVMQKAVPEPEENLIPIARLVKLEEGEKAFEIISLLPKEKTEWAKEEGGGEEAKLGEDGIKEGTEGSEAPEELETALEEEGYVELLHEEEAITKAVEGLREESEGTPTPEPELPESKPDQSKLRVQQGVVRLTADPGLGKNLGTLILEPLRDMARAGKDSNEGEVLIPLSEKEVALDFPFSSLTCHSIISGTLDLTGQITPSDTTETEVGTLMYTNLEFQSTSQGECTVTDEAVAQFGISKVQTRVISDSERIPRYSSDLTELGIGHIPFSLFLNGMQNEGYGDNSDILKHLQLILRVNKADREGFKITCNLLWKWGVTEEILKKIQTQKFGLNWEAMMAWKAVGELME